MATSIVNESQRKAAKVVGLMYLLTNATAIFAAVHVRGSLIAYDSAATTAANIVAHERLFRIGVACDLFTFAADVVIIVGLYEILKPVSRGLALLAAFWRLIETSSLVVITLNGFDTLRFLSGADYLQVFETDRLQALARAYIDAHDAGFNIGLFFLGLGSTIFSYLWFKSNYIPRALAAWGVFSSIVAAACTFAFVIFPNLADTIGSWCFTPIFIFELGIGLWLLFARLRPAGMADLEDATA
jgi:hypothetical protein